MKQKIIFFLFLIILLGSCLKNEEVFIPDDYDTLTSLVSKLKNTNKNSIVINSDKENIIVASENDLIVIPEKAFVDETGNQITGEVLLEYDISKSVRKIIQNNRENYSNDKSLKSFITTELNVKKDDKKLKLAKNSSIKFYINYKSTDDGSLPEVYEYYNNTWNPAQSKAKIKNEHWNIQMTGGTIFGIGYLIEVSSLMELQFAKEVMNPSNQINVCLNLPENFNNKNTVSYALLKNQKQLFKLEYKGNNFCSNIPGGNITKIISITEIGNNISVFEEELNINRSLTITGVPKKITLNELNNWILSL